MYLRRMSFQAMSMMQRFFIRGPLPRVTYCASWAGGFQSQELFWRKMCLWEAY
jgi:hypothetical protein